MFSISPSKVASSLETKAPSSSLPSKELKHTFDSVLYTIFRKQNPNYTLICGATIKTYHARWDQLHGSNNVVVLYQTTHQYDAGKRKIGDSL
jgi:hypothetical protein